MIDDINNGLYGHIQQLFPRRKCTASSMYRTHRKNRYVQVKTPMRDWGHIHYEFNLDPSINGTGYVSLHFEDYTDKNGRYIHMADKYRGLIQYLQEKTEDKGKYSWEDEGWRVKCVFTEAIEELDSLDKWFVAFASFFDNLIKQYLNNIKEDELRILETKDSYKNQSDDVSLYPATLRDILSLPLHIPDYQRIYCWPEYNVNLLLNDIYANVVNTESKRTYRMGAIILHHIKEEGYYDIIDGQQRLITLGLLLFKLGVESNILSQRIESKISNQYIAYNKYLINNYCNKKSPYDASAISNSILDRVNFSVLVLQNTSLDLAYTFFSNQNSKGQPLTDYDLLKAYHLRYIPSTLEKQAMTSAQEWNRMIDEGRTSRKESVGETKLPDYIRTLDICLYRMRQWIRKKKCEDSNTPLRIKREYEAAPIVDEIPPFGEKFYFNEPIQGGTHFFSFVKLHVRYYKLFTKTDEYKTLWKYMAGGTNEWYANAIEAVLFGYFLKFKNLYLSEALMVIMRIVLQHRYTNGRAHLASILQYVSDSELILYTDRATSSTFFLGESLTKAKMLEMPLFINMIPIQKGMHQIAKKINKSLKDSIMIDTFKNLNL